MSSLSVLAVDLALRRYADFGFAILRPAGARCEARLLGATELGLEGEPHPALIARRLALLAADEQAGLILLDGPQAWRQDASDIEHSRLCERLLRAPGKTGLPGAAKPAPFLRFARFSIAVFDALEALGFRRLRNASRLSLPLTLEIFPTAAWRGLGLEPLPAKNNCPVGHLLRYRRALARRARVRFAGELTHDGLQAVAGGLAGIGIVAPDRAACVLVGRPLLRQGGSWREGYIAVPQLRGRNRTAGTRA